MEYLTREPSAVLRPWVKSLWYVRTAPARRFEKILPMPIVHFVVNLGGPYRLVARGAEPIRSSFTKAFVSGLQTRYLVIENPDDLCNLGAQLTPYGLAAFSEVPMSELTDRVRDADDVLPGSGQLRDRALAAGTAPEALALLDDYLTGALHPGFEVNRHAKLAAETMLAEPGLPISEVAERCGISHKSLIDNLKRHCGVTPKAFANLSRFHRFVSELPMGERMPTWSELVSQTGYYDQPHFVRAFREFTGFSPTEYLDAMRRFGPQYPSFVPMDAPGLPEG